ncbi:MAG: S9 family peptidase [Firmicutes bacterium]|nr:S9 family peptidase [Bacillota bacterium]
MKSIWNYLAVRQATHPAFTADGHHLLFLMNLTGTFQVFRTRLNLLEWPDGLDLQNERVADLHTAPQGPWAIITRDQGGNEHYQLQVLHTVSGESRPLVEDPAAVFSFGAFDPTGEAVAYTSTRRNGKDFDIYLQALAANSQPELLYQAEGSWHVEAFTADGQKLLVNHVESSANNDLYWLDVASRQLQCITPHEGRAVFLSPQIWDNKVFVVSDWNHEFRSIALLKGDGRLEDWVLDSMHDVEEIAWDEFTRILAYVSNVNGISKMTLRNVVSGEEKNIVLPGRGVVSDLSFHPDHNRLIWTFSGPQHNANIWLYDLKAQRMNMVTHAPTADIDVQSFVLPELHRYASFDGVEVPFWLYRPQQASGPVPVIISVHGGPESQERPRFNAWYQYLLAQGFAVAAPNVRGSTGYGKAYSHLDDVRLRQNAVADLKTLVERLRQDSNLDSSRIALLGGSYGGFMVLAGLTTYPELFQAGVDIVGIANFETFLEHTGPWRRKLREAEYGSLATDREFLREISPIHHVDKIAAPLLVVHGANDPRVPVEEAEQIVHALQQQHKAVAYLRFEDEGHGIGRLHNQQELYPAIVDFLQQAFYQPASLKKG